MESRVITDIVNLQRRRDALWEKTDEARNRLRDAEQRLGERKQRLGEVERAVRCPLVGPDAELESAMRWMALKPVLEKSCADIEAQVAGLRAEIQGHEERRAEVERELREAEGIKPAPAPPPKPEPRERSAYDDFDDLRKLADALDAARRQGEQSLSSCASFAAMRLGHLAPAVNAAMNAVRELRVWTLVAALEGRGKGVTPEGVEQLRADFTRIAGVAESHLPTVERLLADSFYGEYGLRQSGESARDALRKLLAHSSAALGLIDAGRIGEDVKAQAGE